MNGFDPFWGRLASVGDDGREISVGVATSFDVGYATDREGIAEELLQVEDSITEDAICFD